MPAIFRVSSLLIMPCWALMILFPRWRWTFRLMQSPLVIAVPALLYAVLVLPRMAEIWPAVANPSLAGIAALLATPAGATIGWVHFLAFDLFVGRWIFLDNRDRNISPFVMAPILFLTLMLGAAGFLLYLIARAAAPNLPRLRRAIQANPPLVVTGICMLATFVATLIGIVVDDRIITGAAWVKPSKFAISISIYCFTFAWLLGFVKSRPRLTRLAGQVVVTSFVVEMAAIVTQAARGTTSHFNIATPFDTFIWATMALFVTLVFGATLVVACLLIGQQLPDRVFAWSLRLGVVVCLVGMAVAVIMTLPTGQQLAGMAHAPSIVGAHTVGAADGGPTLPFLGWSTTAGDLRAPHFIGLHGLQVLPFLGWLLMPRKDQRDRLGEARRTALIWIAALTYLGVVLLFLWQALRGQSIVHPDTATIAAAIGLISAALISTLVVLVPGLFSKRLENGAAISV